MRFAYTYRSSDGQRHSAEIEAESRDAAYAAIRRELGVKPIKVVATGDGGDGGSPNGRDTARPSRSGALWGAALLMAIALALIGGAAWWIAARRDASPYPVTVNTPQGPVTYSMASPLPRQAIPGDRARIEAAVGNRGMGAFKYPAEAYLARFAEPGRPVENLEAWKFEILETSDSQKNADNPSQRSHPKHSATEADFRAALREPIRVASTDFTEVVDLKRIVAGMKREMRSYLAGGGSVEQYLSELSKRQKLEVSYRENAERRLTGMLNGESAFAKATADKRGMGNGERETARLRTAYGFWLKANASLKSMGIYELPLPDALQGYQAGLGIDE